MHYWTGPRVEHANGATAKDCIPPTTCSTPFKSYPDVIYVVDESTMPEPAAPFLADTYQNIREHAGDVDK